MNSEEQEEAGDKKRDGSCLRAARLTAVVVERWAVESMEP